MEKIKSFLSAAGNAAKWILSGFEDLSVTLRKAPYLLLPILGVAWMIVGLLDTVLGYGTDISTFEILMMGMMINVLLNTEKK